MRPISMLCLFLLLVASTAPAAVPQERGDLAIEARFERGWLAWDEGRYIEALDDFIGVLGSPGRRRG